MQENVYFFVDCMLHGSARRVNSGERRVFVTRYGSSDFRDRYGYTRSPQLLDRLSPLQRVMLEPTEILSRHTHTEHVRKYDARLKMCGWQYESNTTFVNIGSRAVRS